MVIDLLKKADFVLDLATSSWLYTPVYASILNSGVPVLQVIAPKDTVIKRIPKREIGENAKKVTLFMKESKRIRLTSDLGTDLEIVEPGRPWSYFVGYIEKPDHIFDAVGMSGVFQYPKVGRVNGTAVVDGLMMTPPPAFVPKEPVKFTVKDSRIVGIEGGTDARNVEAFFASVNDPNSYLFAHLGFGLDPRIGKAVTTIDAESREGQIDIAFGSSVLPIGGGDVAAKVHCDMLLMDASLIVDDKLIIDKGKILYEKLK
jgi:2,5-dihydroxypyridine 5,6-dioxygenase